MTLRNTKCAQPDILKNAIFLCMLHIDRDAHCVASVAKKLGEVKLGDTAVPALQTSIHHEHHHHHNIGADEKNEPAQATSSTEKVEIEDPTDEGKTEVPVQRDPFLIFHVYFPS